MSCAGIIFSNLNNNVLSRLTMDRTVAAIPFACRYRLIDFALSNMVNANISNINVVANYNYRSLIDHIGSGKDWDLARRAGGISCISPYQTAYSGNVKVYSTHMEALRSIVSYIGDIKEDYVVLSDSDFVANIDLKAVIDEHAESGAEITFVTTACPPELTLKTPRLMFKVEDDGVISDAVMANHYEQNCPDVNTRTLIMSSRHLQLLLGQAEAHNYQSMTYDILLKNASKRRYRAVRHKGYYAYISSFTDYFRRSMELTTDKTAFQSLLGQTARPIYTRVHNSAPVVYCDGANVQNCLVADDCVIEGKVENSILFRGVHVGRNSVVKNSILFGGTIVGEGASLHCVVTDKMVHISDYSCLSGHENLPFYIAKNRYV